MISAVDTTILFYFYANYCHTSKNNLANRFESKTEHEKNHVRIVEKYLDLETTL